ncbi:bifunctional 5,10-methylene-tetrahydrofolate dehydrogenase/5,10-methylene-tetrahydrofolate cyclohydrolase [Nocardioides sp. LMS-CY]|uniref:bifunctional 5,10-methylenetetrahydrofolate dehydrogenase/5,10-methenyltetrahydrofolate cyclohydrolase n=1 Tax=Nocardioides sp. (strain LMS-CY) TaxID=2840457 RepID=UPI001C000B3A|nr:tetrahydrofolate dehydrogenase/cyclohydrolase catalytic domain-containing protein [Nocardioides sp. LMS-CY]QWF20486.1 bifunctional 5,10-methylene-tetrahydrofolate dehydrogenase/5,10-methylene-tetrahydrofolate cyclohydrolase [Nocardioides sp. LMS-CY]
MTARILDGAGTATALLAEVADRVSALRAAGTTPRLATVLVGDDGASRTYVQMKVNRCADVGIDSLRVDLGGGITTSELVGAISELSADPTVHGILLQHPVPGHINERAAFEAIAPEKDVDGVTLTSFAAMSLGVPGFQSCTPGGIVRLLDAHGVELRGRNSVVVGRSPILGLPMGMLLLRRDATVTYCHSRTVDLADVVRRSDLVVAAVGRPDFIQPAWIKPGAVVVDAGYNAGNRGDVDPAAADVADWFTPVPGGVGPMTIATLLEQTVVAAERCHGAGA